MSVDRRELLKQLEQFVKERPQLFAKLGVDISEMDTSEEGIAILLRQALLQSSDALEGEGSTSEPEVIEALRGLVDAAPKIQRISTDVYDHALKYTAAGRMGLIIRNGRITEAELDMANAMIRKDITDLAYAFARLQHPSDTEARAAAQKTITEQIESAGLTDFRRHYEAFKEDAVNGNEVCYQQRSTAYVQLSRFAKELQYMTQFAESVDAQSHAATYAKSWSDRCQCLLNDHLKLNTSPKYIKMATEIEASIMPTMLPANLIPELINLRQQEQTKAAQASTSLEEPRKEAASAGLNLTEINNTLAIFDPNSKFPDKLLKTALGLSNKPFEQKQGEIEKGIKELQRQLLGLEKGATPTDSPQLRGFYTIVSKLAAETESKLANQTDEVLAPLERSFERLDALQHVIALYQKLCSQALGR